jgi:hypothetical protein
MAEQEQEQLTEEQRQEVLIMLAKGFNQYDIIKHMKEKYNIDIEVTRVLKIKETYMKFYTEDTKLLEDIKDGMQKCLSLLQDMVLKLMEKKKRNNFTKADERLALAISDRFIMLWRVSQPTETKEKESFIQASQGKYGKG